MSVNYTYVIEPVVTTGAGAYSDGDVIGGLLDLSALCGGGGGGVIRSVVVTDDANQADDLAIHFFDKKPDVIADGDAFASNVDMDMLAQRIHKLAVAAADYEVINSNAQAIKEDLAISHGSGELWAYIMANGSTPTYGASSTVLRLKVTGWKD